MNQTNLPLQRGSHPPFLPYNFYEAPQYAAYRPATGTALTESVSSDITSPAAQVAEARPKRAGKGRPAIARSNSLKPYLQAFYSPGHALSSLPHLDHIVTGAVNTDFGGNTRPLSKKLVITLLQRLDVITAEAVRTYMRLTLRQCSPRHAQKIAQCLRVIEQAARKVAEAQWPPPGEAVDHSNFSSANYIIPCGDDACTICGRWPQQSRDGSSDGICETELAIVEDAGIGGAEDW